MTALAPTLGRTPGRVPPVVAAAIAVGWALLVVAQLSGHGQLLHHHHHSLGHGRPLWAALLLFVVGWQAMVAAMMLPTSLPAIRLFAAARGNQPHTRRVQAAFLIGYSTLWTAFGALAFVGLHRAIEAVPSLAQRPALTSGVIFALAGAFQLSTLKQRRLAECCQPAPQLLADNRGGTAAGLRLGLGHGRCCLGCCWALMLLMLTPALATLWSMAALTLLMTYEKLGRHGTRAARLTGIALLAAAILQLAHPASLPAALQGPHSLAAATTIGPGPVTHTLHTGTYRLQLRITPNRATTTGTIQLQLRNRGQPVNHARIHTRLTMVDMNMGEVSTRLRQTDPGTYTAATPALQMPGRWNLRLEIKPTHATPLTLNLVDEIAP